MNKHKRIFLVGHMGGGRALLGKVLAEKLGWQFVDIYLGLERYMGRSLSEIVDKKSEEGILQYQADLLAHYRNKEHVVITTDDTIVLSPKIKQLLSSEYVVYLKISTPLQLERMSQSSFPAFPLLSDSDRKAFLDKLHRERDSLFEELAKLTVDTKVDTKSLENDLNIILKDLEK